MYCKDYGLDPVNVGGGDQLTWFWRWEFLTSIIQQKERREADKWLKK